MLSEGEARVEFGPEIGASLGQSYFDTLKLTRLFWNFQETLDLKNKSWVLVLLSQTHHLQITSRQASQ